MAQLSCHSPIGDITLSEEDGAIVSVDSGWVAEQQETPLLARARAALEAYFDGAPLPADLALAPHGTEFQRRVWQALRQIPHGQTRSYAAMAAIVGGGPRAIGQAVGRNPIPLLIPCHRVVAASSLGGYSGFEGTDTKRFLLALESGQ